jgi:hypothetical protein
MILHDGNLYVSSYESHQVLRYDGQTVDIFVSSGSGGLLNPQGGNRRAKGTHPPER